VPVGINADAANIPAVNFVDQGSDPANPGSGHVLLYTKGGEVYVRGDTGAAVPVGGTPALAEGQIAIGDGSDLLSALALGTEGDVLTADAAGMATWAAPAGGGEAFVGVRYTSNTNASIPGDNSAVIVDFEDIEYDSGGGSPLVTTGATWKFTAPSTGYYRVSVFLLLAASSGWATVERALMSVYKGGALYAIIARMGGISATDALWQLYGTTTVYLAATNYVDVRLQQNNGASIALATSTGACWVCIEKVG